MGEAVTDKQDLPAIPFASPEEWEAWLEENHANSEGTWLKLAKKDLGIESVSFEEALEVALCYGWIDSKASSLDDHYWLQRFTPRRARSNWSERNRTRATKLIEEGRMKPSGLREVERARADGRHLVPENYGGGGSRSTLQPPELVTRWPINSYFLPSKRHVPDQRNSVLTC